MSVSNTFTTQCSQVGSFSYAKNFTLYVILTDRDGNSSTNISYVDYNVYCQSSGSGSLSANHALSFSLNGQTIRSETVYVNVKSPNAYISISSGTLEVTHDDNGTKQIPFSASISATGGYGLSASNSGTFTLETIPRYATVTTSLRARTVNSISINWNTNADTDHRQYSINGGSTWINTGDSASMLTSGYYTISNLSVNTTYNIITRAKRKDSQLWSTSNTVTVTTYNIATITSVPNVNIGNSQTIAWSNPSGATTTLKLCKTDGTQLIDYGTVTGTSKTVTPSASTIYALIPNSNSITLRYILTTTANSQSYTNYKDCVFTVVNSNPTFSQFTYQDINSETVNLTGNNQILIKGYSNVQGTVSSSNKAVAKNSASMSSYRMIIGTKNNTTSYATTDVNIVINSVDNSVIDMYAIDSRGNSTKVSKTAELKDYSNIKIKSLTAIRENNVGQAVTINFEAEFWNNSFGSITNSVTSCIYKYKQTQSSEYVEGETELTYTITENKITGNVLIKGDLGASGFNVANSYNIQLILSDELSTDTFNVILGSGNPAIAIYKNSVAIGQQYDTSDDSKLQVNGNTNVKGNLRRNGVDVSDVNHKHGLIHTDFATGLSNTTTDNGWSMINSTYYGYMLKSIRSDYNAPGWILGNYSAGICFGGGDTHGVISCAYDMPYIKFAGGNGSKPRWWTRLNLSTEKTYTFPASSGTVMVRQSLYDNTTGTTGTVTLSETSANFAYIDIFYLKGTCGYHSVRVYNANGKVVNLISTQLVGDQNTFQTLAKKITVSGTSITVDTTKTGYGNANQGSTNDNRVENSIYITKVLGYK